MGVNTELALITRATCFACEAHATHRRKGVAAEPYVNHLAEVAMLLAQFGADPNLIAAGYLHDTLEDTEVTFEELKREFGGDIAGLVLHATDDDSLPSPVRKSLQIERASGLPPRAQQLRVCDKISNLRAIRFSPPSGWSDRRKIEYFDWANKVVAGCHAAGTGLIELFEQTYRDGLALIAR